MKKFATIIIYFFFYTYLMAQSITPIVVSSADNFVAHSDFSVSSTWGDFMAQTFTRTQNTNTNMYSVEANEVSLSVYPNPSLGAFYINISGSKNRELFIVVRDVLGNECYSKALAPSNDKEMIGVDPENQLTPGVYFVIAYGNDNILAKKIVINK